MKLIAIAALLFLAGCNTESTSSTSSNAIVSKKDGPRIAVRDEQPSARQFDLKCETKFTQRRPGEDADPPVPLLDTLRLDLDEGRWCNSTCKETKPIYAISDREIVLESSGGEDVYPTTVIHRDNGRYESNSKVGGIYDHEEGFCKKAPFSGFPTPQF